MNILFTARHFNASQHLQTYIESALSKLEKYFEGIQDVNVVAEPNENPDKPQRIEVRMNIPGTVLTVTEEAETYETATNRAVDNLKRQLLKYKEKNFAH